MGYSVEKKTQIQSELGLLMPRLKTFAAVLTGNIPTAQALVRATCKYVLAKAARERGHTPLALWTYMQMHTLWLSREMARGGKSEPQIADLRLFAGQDREREDGARSGAMARFVAHLPPQQRATLLLVYGEGLSYDEVAEIFGVPVTTVMTRLARGHAALARHVEQQGSDASEGGPQAGPHRAAPALRADPRVRAA